MKNLPPAYFALVMATGFISIAAWNLQFFILSTGLFAFNLVAFAVLAALTVIRALRYPRLFLADLTDHRFAPGFFTAVAASGVIGAQFFLLEHAAVAASVFLALAVVLWLGVNHAVFLTLIVKRDKPPLGQAITGVWLVAVVATQSIAELASLVGRDTPLPHRLEFNFVALTMWLCGGFLYGWIVGLLLYRYLFLPVLPGDLSPTIWINMGAMSISTLAGARLIENAPEAPFLATMLPFLKGFTVLCWATATWWAPILLELSLWRHLIKRMPLAYDPLCWGAVFPLGMYSAATWQMAKALSLPFLDSLSWAVFWVALAAWSLAIAGMMFEFRNHYASRFGPGT